MNIPPRIPLPPPNDTCLSPTSLFQKRPPPSHSHSLYLHSSLPPSCIFQSHFFHCHLFIIFPYISFPLLHPYFNPRSVSCPPLFYFLLLQSDFLLSPFRFCHFSIIFIPSLYPHAYLFIHPSTLILLYLSSLSLHSSLFHSFITTVQIPSCIS